MSDDSTWDGYRMAIDMWEKSYKIWKKSGEDALKFYLEGCNSALKTSNMTEFEKYNALWEKTLEKLSINPFVWNPDVWSKMWKGFGFGDADAMSKYWQDMWKSFENKESES